MTTLRRPDLSNLVPFADVGWTDITVTTVVAVTILEALGYQTKTLALSLPLTYASLASGDVDVFLGNWMPTMEEEFAPYREAGRVETVRVNLSGAEAAVTAALDSLSAGTE